MKFTEAQYAKLLELRAQGKTWTEIGEAIGHGANSCSSIYCVRQREGRQQERPRGGNAATNPWTKEQLALLGQMGAEGQSWDACSAACGHSPNSCKVTYNAHKRQQWSSLDAQRLRHLRDIEHKSFQDIAQTFNRTKKSCIAKYWDLVEGSPQHGQREPGMRVTVTPAALADRDARYQARLQQSPAAALMGDPLPGRSALDGFIGMSEGR